MADRSSGAGDLICAIELLLLVVVVGDAGRAQLGVPSSYPSRPACGMSAGSFSAYLVSSGPGVVHHCWEQYIKRAARRPSSTL